MADPFTIIMAVTTAVSGITKAAAQRSAGKAQEDELQRQAEQERIAAEGRELQRREELNKVLAARQVALATSGLAGEGTPQSIALSAAEKISLGEGMETLSSQLKRAQLKRAGKNARITGNIQAASTLLDTGVKTFGFMSSPPSSPKAKPTGYLQLKPGGG